MRSVLRPAFNILTCCGCWRPSKWSTMNKRILYRFHTVFMFFLLYSFCASQFLYAMLLVKSADEFSEAIYMFFPTFMACCKIITVLVNHRDIKTMASMLEKGPCKPTNAAEATIQKEFDQRIGSVQYK
ncbi:uncharacterized protein LOC143153031 [Ptiloglossa arizonensis]|uniref:uncharacterized protein LOC143153031 n=1 Tax=Ptiloglossa arizonensis TaxID=3350558 RepID=UPI003FA192B3